MNVYHQLKQLFGKPKYSVHVFIFPIYNALKQFTTVDSFSVLAACCPAADGQQLKFAVKLQYFQVPNWFSTTF